MSVKKFLELASIPVAVGTFAALFLLERRRPLRRLVEDKSAHTIRNLAAGGVAAVALQLIERPVAARLSNFVEHRRVGLLKYFRLPRVIEAVLAVVLMDYTLYLWHVLTH